VLQALGAKSQGKVGLAHQQRGQPPVEPGVAVAVQESNDNELIHTFLRLCMGQYEEDQR
jgi:hypothetical protein